MDPPISAAFHNSAFPSIKHIYLTQFKCRGRKITWLKKVDPLLEHHLTSHLDVTSREFYHCVNYVYN